VAPLIVEATFEDGVLKPMAPLPLQERDKVRLTVEKIGTATVSPPLNMAKFFDGIETDVGLFDGPPDLAAESDHYLYGAPKAPPRDGR
jgi:predicted DNA-binding antitoxin AbrB/MazE fold protein